MKILILMDPLKKLSLEWDCSLALLREFHRRRHTIWTADIPDLWAENQDLFAAARLTAATGNHTLRQKNPEPLPLTGIDLVVVRKEPPFNENYIHMTYLLDRLASQVAISNHPSGIRDTNEKLGILNFPGWIPKTLSTQSPDQIEIFRQRLESDLILKPLDQKGGTGIIALRKGRNSVQQIKKITRNGTTMVQAQEFIAPQGLPGDKRILILGDKILTAFERHCKPGEFRANLSQGGTAHACRIMPEEKKLAAAVIPYCREKGLDLVALDLVDAKLIEINVTCPAGLTEAETLYPNQHLIKAWADYLEHLRPRPSPRRCVRNPAAHTRGK